MVNLATARSSRKYVAAFAVLAVASSIALAPAAQAKRLSLQMPTYDKLIGGAGPETNDVRTGSGASSPSLPANGAIDLRPLTLDGPASTGDATTGDGRLLGEVEKDDFAAKNHAGNGNDPTAAASGKSQSVVPNGQASKLVKDGKKVNVAPLALMESEDETQKKVDTIADAEKVQLQDLWQATILRNPDIQFVINKLQPTSDQSHATAYMMKALGQALFGIMSAAPLMMPSPSPAMFMGSNAGASLLSNLFLSHEAKAAKKYAISQEQATILYKIVRDVADKLVENYRDYKKEMTRYEAAQKDFEDLQSMVAQSNATVDAAKAIEMEYTLRKAKRDIEALGENIRRERQGLVDLGGPDAVAKLDEQLSQERGVLMQLAGDQSGTSLSPQLNPQLSPIPQLGQTGDQKTAEKKSGKPM